MIFKDEIEIIHIDEIVDQIVRFILLIGELGKEWVIKNSPPERRDSFTLWNAIEYRNRVSRSVGSNDMAESIGKNILGQLNKDRRDFKS